METPAAVRVINQTGNRGTRNERRTMDSLQKCGKITCGEDIWESIVFTTTERNNREREK